MNNDHEDELNKIAKGLADELMSNPPNNRSSTSDVKSHPPALLDNDASIEKYVNDSAQKSNDVLLQVIEKFARDVGDDPERASALATLIKSNTDTLKLLNDQIIKRRDNETKLAIQKMKSEGDMMKETISKGNSVITSREEMFKNIIKDAEEVDLVDEEDEDDDD